MKRMFLFFAVIVTVMNSLGQNTIEGTYKGLEKICWKISKKGECNNDDNERPGGKWYHLNWLKINGDSCFLDQNPVVICQNDTSFSASDGGFLYYSGKVIRTDSAITLNMEELFCDYAGHFHEKQADGTYKRIKRTKQYLGSITDSGIVINNFLYTRFDNGMCLKSEYPPDAYMIGNPHYKSEKLIEVKFRNPLKKKKVKKS